MFDLLTDPFVDLKRQNLIHLFQSLNQPQVSPGVGLGAQAAEGYLMVFQIEKQMSIYVGLYFRESSQRILYYSGLFSPDVLEEKLSSAESFVGEMGFMMDNVHLASATDMERADLIRTVPFFYKDMDLYFKALRTSEIEVKKAKEKSVEIGKGEGTASRDAQAELQKVFLEQYVTMVSML